VVLAAGARPDRWSVVATARCPMRLGIVTDPSPLSSSRPVGLHWLDVRVALAPTRRRSTGCRRSLL